ncbi:MAG: hypothetical protein Q8N60_02835 [Candidatus Diapherotrites archaeon]|nr:hypothetical protein [Candidatus Diapherotrites archaeon]
MFETLIGVLTKPEETMAAEKANASIVRGIINFAIAALIMGFIAGAILTVISLLIAPFIAMISIIPGIDPVTVAALKALTSIGILAIVIVPIVAIILTVIASLLANLVMWISAKIAGGSGSFSLQYYLLSLIATPSLLVYLLFGIILIVSIVIPIIGLIGMPVAFAISGYLSIISTMAYIAAMKESHGFNTFKVAMATGISSALMIVLATVLAVVIKVLGAALFYGY